MSKETSNTQVIQQDNKETLTDVRNAVIKDMNAVITSSGSGQDPIDEDREYLTGQNGYSIGQEFLILETPKPHKVTIGDRTTVSLAVKTTGGYIALRNLMGLSSDRGYSHKNGDVFDNETYVVEKEDGATKQVKQTTEVKVYTAKEGESEPTNWTYAIYWKPAERDLYAQAAYMITHPDEFVGKKFVYCGMIVRQITAVREPSASNQMLYHIGYKRAMTSHLWRLV